MFDWRFLFYIGVYIYLTHAELERGKIMNRVSELAKKVQKEANEITGWGFSLVPQEDAYLVGTSLTKKTKYTINVVFEIRANAVVINTFIPKCKYDESITKIALGNLNFPIECKGEYGKILIVKSKIPFQILEINPTIIIKEMMIPLVDALTTIIKGGVA